MFGRVLDTQILVCTPARGDYFLGYAMNFIMHSFTTHAFQYYDLSILPMSKATIRRCSIKKGVLRIFSKFTGNHLCQSFFFNKVAGPKGFIKKGVLEQVCNFIKKRLWHSSFPMNFAKF